MAQPAGNSSRYDAWYSKAAFGFFLCVLVGVLVVTYSGIWLPA